MEDIDNMTGPELVALYNQHADTPVKRFATKAEALKRIRAVLPNTTATSADNCQLKWLVSESPKRPASVSGQRAAKYWGAPTVAEMLARGGTRADLRWDISRGYVCKS